MQMEDDKIVDSGWYWARRKDSMRYEIMQAHVTPAGNSHNREIEWWEIMKDWATNHDEIEEVLHPQIMLPAPK